MEVSVIIPCYLLPDGGDLYPENELLELTKQCLDSLHEHCGDFELVLIDNGSPIGGDYLRHKADVYIRFQENLGFAPAVNAGLRLASGDFLVVSNNDIVFVEDWIKTAQDAWQANTGLVCSHLLDNDPKREVGRCKIPLGHFFGSLWMTSHHIINAIGYLDENYKIGMYEDKDYVKRVEAVGYEVIKVGHCQHVGNATWGKLPNQQKVFVQNQERFKRKWS